MSACSSSSFAMSAGAGWGSFIPWMGISSHAVWPSYPWLFCMPWTVMSIRIFFGRLTSITIGTSRPGPSVMLPVILTAAFGFYSMLHGRQQVRLIAGYVREFLESKDPGLLWFTRLGNLEALPGFNHPSDWLTLCLADAVIVVAVVFSWLYAAGVPRGDLMAGIVTGLGIVFGFHSVSEMARLRQANSAAFWRQVSGGSREDRPALRMAGR